MIQIAEEAVNAGMMSRAMTPRVGNILFSGPMVRALLAGRKTQTRRLAWKIAKDANQCTRSDGDLQTYRTEDGRLTASYFLPTRWLKMHRRFEEAGHRELLRVREGFRRVASGEVKSGYCEARYGVAYRADGHVDWNENVTRIYDVTEQPGSVPMQFDPPPWSPSIHMRNYESRLTLEVTGTKLERLQDIEQVDAEAEGVRCDMSIRSFRDHFALLWDRLHGPDAWKANPEVVALSFKVHRCNVDEVTL